MSSKKNLSVELGETKLISNLEETIRYLKHLKFGKSSEKYDGKQSDLFNEVEVLNEENDRIEEDATKNNVTPPAKKRAKTKPRVYRIPKSSMAYQNMKSNAPVVVSVFEVAKNWLFPSA